MKQVAKQLAAMCEGITNYRTVQSNLNQTHSIITDILKKLQKGRDLQYSTMRNALKKEKANYMKLATRFNVFQERVEQDHVEFSTL